MIILPKICHPFTREGRLTHPGVDPDIAKPKVHSIWKCLIQNEYKVNIYLGGEKNTTNYKKEATQKVIGLTKATKLMYFD